MKDHVSGNNSYVPDVMDILDRLPDLISMLKQPLDR
jgi:hypothetical protein